MDRAELEAVIDRLDAMRERCDALIKPKPLEPDRTLGKKRLTSDYLPNVVASGPLAGNEMRVTPGHRPRKSTFVDMQDGSIDAIFADFEAQFDEMIRG